MTTDLAVAPAGTLVHADDEEHVRRVCGEITRQWLLEHRNTHTSRAYRRCIENWFDWTLGNRVSPLAARREHSAQWAADLNEVLAPSSVNQALSAMSSWYEFGLDEYEHAYAVRRSPYRKKHRLDVSDESQTIGLDREEAVRLREVSWEYGPLDAAVIEILLGMGLRSAELEDATFGAYGEARGHRTLTVHRKRTKKQTLAVPPDAARALDEHLARRSPGPDDRLLICPDGQPLTNRRIAGIVQRCCRAARIPKPCSPHGLRHTCATLTLDAGASLRRVQRLLGHADPRTTNRYDLARVDLDSSPVYDLADFLAGKKPSNR
ncbi:tyrosine-type recombinase/integrase [Streptomyces cellulosae]